MLDVEKLNVLIADDSQDLRLRLRRLLSRLDFVERIKEAASAYEALDLIEEDNFDVAILDIQMPGSGIKALKKIKSNHPNTRIVMLTNHADNFYKRICLNAGADFFLDKTLEFRQLPDVLNQLAENED